MVETLMGTGKEGTNDGTGETCTFAQVNGICCLQSTIFVSDVAAGMVKIVSPLTGTLSFLQTLGKLNEALELVLWNEYIKSTVATVKRHCNMKD